MRRANATLTNSARRELILRALAKENRRELAQEYGVNESRIYRLLSDIRKDPEKKLADAEAEAEFWREVSYALANNPNDVGSS